MASNRQLNWGGQIPQVKEPDMGNGIQSIMPFISNLAMMNRMGQMGQMGQQKAASGKAPNSNLKQEGYQDPYGNKYGNPQYKAQEAAVKSKATQAAAPGGVATQSTDAMGIHSIIPSAAVNQGGVQATQAQAGNFVQQGALAERAIAELKNAVASYKNVLAERKSSGGDPYDTGTSISQDYLTNHPWQRKMASSAVPTSSIPGYQTSKDAFGGAMASMFVQGQRNPSYAQKLGGELTPSLTSTGADEDTNLIRQSALTPIATEWALSHGLITASNLANIKDWKDLAPVVNLAQQNGWNPNASEVQSKIDEILRTPPSDPRFSHVKVAGFDYPSNIKETMAQYIAKYPDKKQALLQRYKEQTGEEYNG